MIAPAFTFQPEGHLYRLDGRVIPSVSEVIERLYTLGHIPEWILAAKSAIGTEVHAASELVDEDDLDETSLSEGAAPYVAGYQRFLRENDVRWTHTEHKAFHSTRGYAGTLDREGWVNGESAMVDLKTTAALSAMVGVQLAGYVELRRDERRRAGDDTPYNPKRLALQLLPTGKYKLVPYAAPDDLPCFLSLLTLYHWKARHE